MNYPLSVIIQCPFFVGEKKNIICCEGVATRTCITTAFHNREEKLDYVNKYCLKKDGGSCHLAKTLYRKYEVKSDKQ